MRLLDPLFRLLTGRRSAWACLALAVMAVGAVFALVPVPEADEFPGDGLPDDIQSVQVDQILSTLPSADSTSGIAVYWREDATLTDADRTAIETNAPALAKLSDAPPATTPQFSEDGVAAIVVVPLTASEVEEDIAGTAEALREAAGADLPDGLNVALTGPVGFQADISAAFAGADTRLLLVTIIVVALLLIVTYRSPVLWLVPLIVVAVGDALARQVLAGLGGALERPIDASVSGIVSVLVFGAGTNYALLIVARYREELHVVEDHREAMRGALRSTYPAVLASGSTVAVSLLTLLLASLQSNQTLGWAGAVGIVLAMAAALLILPSALVVCGRKLFWPFVPHFSVAATGKVGFWERLARTVARAPKRTVAASTVLLAVLATGLVGLQVGLPQTSQFVGTPDSVTGQEAVAKSFGAGLGSATLVVVPEEGAAAAQALIDQTPGVSSVRPSESGNGYTVLSATLEDAPASDEAFDTIRTLRSELADADAPVSESLVGGADARGLDALDLAQRDQKVIVPVILAVVLLILILLLRSVVAPILLMVTVVATFVAATGAGNLIFTKLMGYPGVDTSVPLFAFLFLVALGVDYNIFLTTRAREERENHGTREGMVRAVSATGGVITSAGILLAAVFAVLGVLPVVALMQIGVIVCIGVLLDTLVVRTLVVPALTFWLGERFWWPSREPRTVQVAPEESPATEQAHP